MAHVRSTPHESFVQAMPSSHSSLELQPGGSIQPIARSQTSPVAHRSSIALCVQMPPTPQRSVVHIRPSSQPLSEVHDALETQPRPTSQTWPMSQRSLMGS